MRVSRCFPDTRDRADHRRDVENGAASSRTEARREPFEGTAVIFVREGVAGDVEDVVGRHVQVVEGVERLVCLGAAGGDKGAFGGVIGNCHAEAEVLVHGSAHVLHADRPKALRRDVGEGPLPHGSRVHRLSAGLARGVQDVVAASHVHAGIVTEDVATGLGYGVDPNGDVDDDLPGMQHTARHCDALLGSRASRAPPSSR